jgi:anthranilate/para-aminobenzoate synthase component II
VAVMRYHSLIVEPDTLPGDLEVTARAEDDPGEIHAFRHRKHPVWGVQFHPESVMTDCGRDLLGNFMELANAR